MDALKSFASTWLGWFGAGPDAGEGKGKYGAVDTTPKRRARSVSSSGSNTPGSRKKLKIASPEFESPKSEKKSPKSATKEKTPVVKRSRSKTPGKSTSKAGSSKTPTTTSKRKPSAKSWSASWDVSSENKWFCQGINEETWYEIRINDVINKEDERCSFVDKDCLQNKRGLDAPALKKGTKNEFTIKSGDWIRVHYQGFNVRYDEWVLFIADGYICTNEKSCKCARHL